VRDHKPGAHGIKGDSGYSLVELLVVVVIFAGLLSIVFGVLINVERQTKDTLSREDQVGEARLGLAQIDRQVRSGNVVIDPATVGELPRSLRIYTQTDGVRRCVQWQVTSTGLRFRSWDPGWSYVVGTVDPWRVIARYVRSDAGAPVSFERVTAAANSQAQSIRVRLWLQAADAGGRPVEATTVLTGRDTIYGYSADVCSPVPPA
jgi:prepilin-type N-terminal cleavage/methylation domain-containing protein